jgi:outer membrane protein
MKNQFLAISGAFALTIAGFAIGSTLTNVEAESAQKTPVILTVSLAQIVDQSKAGKSIPDQAQKVLESVQSELEAEAKKLAKDIESFQKNSSLMSEEVRQQKQQELMGRQQYGLPQKAQIMEKAFSAAVQNARSKVLIESQPLIKDIVDKRGATLVLDKATVMFASTETDITQEVISGLDKKLDKVEVQKISLAEVMKQLEEAQKAQAEASKK